MAAIADACSRGSLLAQVVLVLSDVEDSGILAEAARRGLPHRFVAPGFYRTKLDDRAESEFVRRLEEARADWVVLAGFMRILKRTFLRAFPRRIVNIHPSLLPSFPGLDAASQALEHGVRVTGTTVHLVDSGIDTGTIIAQQPVPVELGDTPATLQDRIRQTEHILYPGVLGDLVSGRLSVQGRKLRRLAPGPSS